jgi:hypothetical protein
MEKRTRLKITLLAGILLSLISLASIWQQTENIGMAAIGGIMTILSGYIWGETKRPSKSQ